MEGTGSPTRPERWVHRSLLAGLLLSGLLLFAGLALVLLRGEGPPEGLPPSPRMLLDQAARGSGVAILDLGLLALIGTPILRVGVLAIAWGIAGERRFTAVATAVLALLGLGLALGVH